MMYNVLSIFRRTTTQQGILSALIVAWLGLWGAWIPAAAASLIQNVFYFSEWATYLNDVRYGALRLSPDVLRLAVAASTGGLALAAASIADWRWRWAVRALLAGLVVVFLLPPYPDVFQLWWSPSYGLRFLSAAALAALTAASALTDRAALRTRSLVILALCLVGIVASLWGVLVLMPVFQTLYAQPLGPGWGLILFEGGLLAALVLLIWGFARPQ